MDLGYKSFPGGDRDDCAGKHSRVTRRRPLTGPAVPVAPSLVRSFLDRLQGGSPIAIEAIENSVAGFVLAVGEAELAALFWANAAAPQSGAELSMPPPPRGR